MTSEETTLAKERWAYPLMFRVSNAERRFRADDLQRAVLERLMDALEPVIEDILVELAEVGHVMTDENESPVSDEFAFSDSSRDFEGLRLAVNMVVSAGFADRRPNAPDPK
jgi:hypothetical protein